MRGAEVAPRDMVAAALPDPATLGERMHGKTCAGTLVTGHGQGRRAARRPTSTTWPTTSRRCASTAPRRSCCQTALNPVVALELLANGTWSGAGVLGPEAFDAVPFLDLLAEYGESHGQIER